MTVQSSMTQRQEWMQVLAHAGDDLQQFEEQLAGFDYRYIRIPETGMVMARGRTGGTGQAFNVGEVTVTRCVVRLNDSGTTGYSYVLGRSLRNASIAALMDALLQGPDSANWFDAVIVPLQQQQQQRRAQREREVAGSKVDFFTMVRGD